MAEIVYLLCALMSTACAFLLLRGSQKSGSKLLLWSGLCFALLALNNIVLVVDLVILPDLDFHGRMWRNAIGGLAGSLLLFGLVWELT
jgi:hypothetical protein